MSAQQKSARQEHLAGIWYAVAAYMAWGFLPIYWKAIKQVPAGEILAHRVVWSLSFVAVLLTLRSGWGNLRVALRSGKERVGIFLGAVLISANWFTYIWAVNSDHVVEASLGYYINPLFTVLLGILVLKERMDGWQLASLVLAFAGVAFLTVQYGRVPWVAILLAVTFGLYSLVKKLYKIDSISGLALETAFIAPAALGYLIYLQLSGAGSFGVLSWNVTVLLICSGVATATPLLWFAQAAKKVPLSTIGFIQYLSPSISLILGIFLYKEPFTTSDIIAFGLIWGALAVYSLSRFDLVRSRLAQSSE